MRQSPVSKFWSWCILILLGIVGALTLYPFVYTASMSLSTAAEANRSGFHLLPGHLSWNSYKMVLSNPNIGIGYMNTLFRTVVGTTVSVIVTCLCAYPLTKKDLPHRRTITFLMLFTMLFSGGIVPGYLLIRNLHLIDNVWVYILPGLIGAFNVIIVKNFFQQIPESLAESAKLDGANDWTILFRIYMPLSKPVLATVALWTAVGHWNAWFDSLLYMNTPDKYVLQMFLRRIVIENSTQLVAKGLVNPDVTQFTPETIKAATVMITILPILLLYPFVQKYFVKGIMLGGVKE